jgi:MFS family permease
LITGLGSAFCFLGPIRLATDWFSPRQMALVTGVIVTIAMIGGMTAQYPLTKLVNLWGWRQAVIAIAWAGVFMLLVMAVCIKEKPKASIRHKTISLYTSLQKAYANMHTLKAALYTSLMNMAIAVFGAMMGSLYLIEKLLITKEEAALVNTLLFLGAIVGGPLIGFFSDKCRLRILPMKIGAVVSLLVALAIIYMPVSLGCMKILFFLLGFFTSAQIISYALVAESTPSSITATAVSVVSVLTQGGYIVYQNVFSYLLLYHGDAMMKNGVPVYSAEDYQFAAMVLPLGLLIALWSLRGLKETHCHSERESK